MGNPIPQSVRRMWDTWNIRVLILFSLSLQTFLILFAPARKRSSRHLIIFFLWSGYLLADATANFVVGLISNNQSNSNDNNNEDLLAFWAPFLLVHLGGPGTITAFAVEDNALWLRHLIGLFFQVVPCSDNMLNHQQTQKLMINLIIYMYLNTQVIATLYIFVQTVPQNKLEVPGILMFLAGIIKYAERTRALYQASLGSFRDSMLKKSDSGPNYAKLMEEYAFKDEANLPVRIELTDSPDKESRDFMNATKVGHLKELEIIQYAFMFFKNFKGLIVDMIISFKERNASRDFFLMRSPSDALKVIEVELNFFYEVLFTKVAVVHNIYGVIFRLISCSCVIVAFALFTQLDKGGFRKLDVGITYALLIGALALDLISFLITLFSDWTIASIRMDDSFSATILEAFLKLKRQMLSELTKPPFKGYKKLHTPFIFRRWRESVSQFNLITYCLCERIQRKENLNFIQLAWDKSIHVFRRVIDIIIDYLGAKEFVDNWKYVERQPVLVELWELIFNEMKKKSKEAENAEVTKEICSSRGSYVLKSMTKLQSKHDIVNALKPFIDAVSFDESLMLWHIATELCYQTEDNPHIATQLCYQTEDISINNKDTPSSYYKFSKLLSDYMLYLIEMHPTLTSAVAGIARIRFRDTCAEAKKFFDRKWLGTNRSFTKDACKKILLLNTRVDPVTVKGDKSKSVLFDAKKLAKKLQEFGDEKWEIMSKVWIEMLGYAASHCRPEQHAQQLTKGGELLTFIWLLMVHFGLGEQFQINKGNARAKLVVGDQ